MKSFHVIDSYATIINLHLCVGSAELRQAGLPLRHELLPLLPHAICSRVRLCDQQLPVLRLLAAPRSGGLQPVFTGAESLIVMLQTQHTQRKVAIFSCLMPRSIACRSAA